MVLGQGRCKATPGQKTPSLRWHGDMLSHPADGIPPHLLEELQEIQQVTTHAGAWPGHRGRCMPLRVERLAEMLCPQQARRLARHSTWQTVLQHHGSFTLAPRLRKTPSLICKDTHCLRIPAEASGRRSLHRWAGGPGLAHLTTTAGYDMARCSTS